MNNIGSAATQTTAAKNNTNSAQSLANLSSLASSFTNSTSSAGGLNFNNLIMNLLMQVIQTLLKNMQNKSCCDQSTKPQTLSLSDAEKTKLADALSTDGKAVTIVSAEDSDKSGKLSVGDKINVRRPTGQLNTQGEPILESASVKLTEKQLDDYQLPNLATINLSISEQNKLLNAISLGRNFINTPSIVNVIDSDNNGSLSVGDQINLKAFSGRHDEITGEPVFNYSTETLTAEQLSSYQNTSKDLSLSTAEKNKLIDILAIGSTATIGSPTVTGVTDTDNNGVLSVGDVINIANATGGYYEDTNEPVITYSKTPLTAEQFSNYQNLTKEGELLDVSQREQNWLQTAYNSAFYGASGAPTVVGVVYDNDNSGDISVGDSIGLRQYVGEGAPKPEGPYQVSLGTLGEQRFDEYLKAKAADPGPKGS